MDEFNLDSCTKQKMNFRVVLVSILAFGFCALVDAKFYLERPVSGDGLGTKRGVGVILYECDGALDIQCTQITTNQDKKDIYDVTTFNSVAYLKLLMGHKLELDRESYTGILPRIMAMGVEPGTFTKQDRPKTGFIPSRPDPDNVDKELREKIHFFVDFNNGSSLYWLKMYLSINNIAYLFAFTAEPAELFAPFEATLQKVILASGYNVKVVPAYIPPDEVTPPKKIPTTRPAPPRQLEEYKRKRKPQPQPQPQPMSLPEEDMPTVTPEPWFRPPQNQPPPYRPQNQPPPYRPRNEPPPSPPETNPSPPIPFVLRPPWSLPRTSSNFPFPCEPRPRRLPSSSMDLQGHLDRLIDALWGLDRFRTFRFMSQSLTKPQTKVVSIPIENKQSQTKAVSIPVVNKMQGPRYRQPPTRRWSQPPPPPDPSPPTSPPPPPPKSPTKNDLMQAVEYLAFKMIDPCFTLIKDENQLAQAQSVCRTFCQFLGMTFQVFELNSPSRCKNLNSGQCENNVCKCATLSPYGYASGGYLNMVVCNNAFRLFIYK